MSRAYRISVRESIRRVVRGSDRVATRLELLEILPRQQMAEQLAEELRARGFADEDGELVRRSGGVTIRIDAGDGTIVVESEIERNVEIEAEKQGYADEDFGRAGRKAAEKRLREELRKELEGKAERSAGKLDSEATDQLEAALGDLQGELDSVVNRVTAEALKAKAAQLGEIKQISEDAQSGNMTIVLEV
jgi:hypothetical protein